MVALLGSEAEELVRALERPAATGVRINTRTSDPGRIAAALPWDPVPVPWCPSGFVLRDPPDRPGRHPWHAAGVMYLQDPSAMAVAEAVDVRPGMWVADLAAAPGGKATRLVERVGPEGLLLANDVNADRALALGQNLERWGADNAILTRAEVGELASVWSDAFDVVLLDAPCSGEGMFRKSPEARAMWSESVVEACALRQHDLLQHAARLVARGGALVYSTCTFAPEEDEGVVDAFLAQHPNFAIEPVELPGVASGRPDWTAPEARDALAQTARLWPHRQDGEGHFVAVLRRSGAAEEVVRPRTGIWAAAPTDLDRASADLVAAFADATFVARPWEGRALTRIGDEVYARPAGAPDLRAGSTIRPGLPLGTLKKKRFEPSHALALAIPPERCARRLELSSDDPALAAYLTGLELESTGEDGWLLVCVDGFALGWGRRVRGVVRNAYPRGLRLR